MQVPGTLDLNDASNQFSFAIVGSYLIVSRCREGSVHRLTLKMDLRSRTMVDVLNFSLGRNADVWHDIRIDVDEEE